MNCKIKLLNLGVVDASIFLTLKGDGRVGGLYSER